MTHADLTQSRQPGSTAAIVSALVAIMLYAVTLRGTYIYDDVAIVHEDPRALQPRQFYKLWSQPFFASSVDKLYRPLVSSSFAIENYLHGDRPWAFHAVNIILHATTSALVALLAARLAGSLASWISGVLFAVHPVHVEAVAGLVGRAESACAIAVLGALLIFLKPGQLNNRRIAGIFGCFLAALFSKEQGILLPLVLLFAYLLRGGWNIPAERKQLKSLAAICLVTTAGYLLLRERVASLSFDRQLLDPYVNPLIKSTSRDRLLMPIVLLGRYTRLLIFPTTLSVDYGGSIIGAVVRPGDSYLYLGLIALLVWFVLFIIAWRRKHLELIFCLLSLGISYGMIGNIVSLIGTIFGDRLMYMPSIFFLLIVSMGLASLHKGVAITLLVLISLAASVRTFTYARLWNDPETLYAYTLKIHPESRPVAIGLAQVYLKQNQWDLARRVAEEISQHMPDRWEPYQIQMEALEGQRRFEDAIAVADFGISHVPQRDKRYLIEWREGAQKRLDASRK